LEPRTPSLAPPPSPKLRTDVSLWGRRSAGSRQNPATSAGLVSAPNGLIFGLFGDHQVGGDSVKSCEEKAGVLYLQSSVWMCPVLDILHNNNLDGALSIYLNIDGAMTDG
jgi:hypothetical protein